VRVWMREGEREKASENVLQKAVGFPS